MVVVLLLFVFLVLPFASASWFSDIFDKLVGKDASLTGNAVGSGSGSGTTMEKKEDGKQACCFCGYDGETDTGAFQSECEDFFEGKENPGDVSFKCDVKEKVKIAEWQKRLPELTSKYQCADPLRIYYAAHGPVCGEYVQFIQTCVSNSPTCSIIADTGSCQTFNNLRDVEYHFAELKKKLGPDVQITSCGNRLNGHFGKSDCTLTSVVKVSQDALSITPGACKPAGSLCSPPDDIAYDCINGQGKRTTQRCCRNAKSLSEYTAYQERSGVTTKGSTEFSLEGEACSIPPCAQQGEQCTSEGNYQCRAPDGKITTQSCCKSSLQSPSTNSFSSLGGSCTIPSCIEIEKNSISCNWPGKKVTCKNKDGTESTQICCGKINEREQYLNRNSRTEGLLGPIGSKCNCAQGASECISNVKPAEGRLGGYYCEYTPATQGSFCGSFKDNICDGLGDCNKLALKKCETPQDCYKGGKNYCYKTSDSRSLAYGQNCVSGLCMTGIAKICKDNKEICVEDDKGASCVRKPKSPPKKGSFTSVIYGDHELSA